MPRKPRTNRLLLTDPELDMMRWVWEKGSPSTSSIQMEMVRDGKETAYTTVKTMMDRLVKSGVCKSREVKGRFHYSPLMSRDQIAREWYRHINEKIFGKSVT